MTNFREYTTLDKIKFSWLTAPENYGIIRFRHFHLFPWRKERQRKGILRRIAVRRDETVKTASRSSLAFMVFLLMGICAFSAGWGAAHAETDAVLSSGDCGKCHAGPANDFEADGGHGGTLCTGCHVGHPPTVAKPFMPCGKCHLGSRRDHFRAEMSVCRGCHTNPHRPLYISLKGAGNETCQLCHAPEILLLKELKSKHSAVTCSRCHDVHRKFPQCVKCHKPHPGIADDCKGCHGGHWPKIENFSPGMPLKNCMTCHPMPASLLGATASKHKSLACDACHKRKHKYIPDCEDCHGTPHLKSFGIKFPECGMCHGSAHDLNNWPATAAEDTDGKAPGKQE